MDGVGLAFRVLALGSPKAFVAGFHVAVFHVAELALNGVIWLGAGEVSGIAFIILLLNCFVVASNWLAEPMPVAESRGIRPGGLVNHGLLPDAEKNGLGNYR
jgi:hypothetical protein